MAGKAGQKVTKADIIDSVYEKIGMSRKEIRTVVDLFIEEVKDSLIQQMVIELRGFGTFEVRIRKGRQKARNPKTGEQVSVNSHGIAAFRPGRELKQDVWNIGATEKSPASEAPRRRSSEASRGTSSEASRGDGDTT
ncbi:DNA-binding protein HBbu [Treponema primitia ZAS-2]|uniref:DNA-binding protein HBbu n=1 Tax=Treponema primitia (strain ATCC BAA-887 / DSM 12427 / ZAS-2) TaxID=545694 RepID=F5YKI8_TREPZ|nr:DNA-binding protein HBbu [Treponema primitia ZAS-2]